MHTCYSRITSEVLSSFDSQISILTRALALPCTLKGFLRCLNEQETSKRGGGVVFIHPSKKTNRYFLTRGHRTRRCNAPDAPVPRNGQNAISKSKHRTHRSGSTGRVRRARVLTGLTPDARPRPMPEDRTRPVLSGPYWTRTGRADQVQVASDGRFLSVTRVGR
jgi:hypothetical protein